MSEHAANHALENAPQSLRNRQSVRLVWHAEIMLLAHGSGSIIHLITFEHEVVVSEPAADHAIAQAVRDAAVKCAH